MQQAHSDIAWLTTDDGVFTGLSLGYERCAEHEEGVGGLLAELGVNIPPKATGIHDHVMTRLPESLCLIEYTAVSKDKRRLGYPAAMLVLSDRVDPARLNHNNPAETLGLSFFPDHPSDKRNRPAWDLLCAWGIDEFAVHVRGEDNIAKLKELHAALLRKDIAFATPWTNSFYRGGISLAILSRVPEDEKQNIAAKYAAYNELEAAVEACGIRRELEEAGKMYHSLSPAWGDEEKTELAFFLSPVKRDQYQYGWFTLQEVQAWIREEGPVLFDRRLKDFEDLPENRDWEYRLVRGLEQKGLALRWGARMCWLKKPGGAIGVRIIAHPKCEGRLVTGVYPFKSFIKRYATSLAQEDSTVST